MRDGRRGIRIYSLLILVAGCALIYAVGVDIYRARDPVRRWIRQSSPGNHLFTRIQAVMNLGRRAPPARLEEVFPILLAVAKDPDPAVRSVAAAALVWRKDRFAEVLPILLVLTKDPIPHVRRSAIYQLSQFVPPGSPEAPTVITHLVAALDDPDRNVRLAACQALALHGQSPRAVPTLVRLVREEKGATGRMGALNILLACKPIPPDVEPTLRAMLGSDRPSVRIRAAQALIEIGKPEAATPVLRELAAGSDERIRRRAGELLDASKVPETAR